MGAFKRLRFLRLVRPAGAVLVVSALLIALVLTLLPAGPFVSDRADAATTAQLQQKLQNTQSQLQQLRSKMSQAEVAKKAAQGDIVALDQNIQIVQAQADAASAAWELAAAKLDTLQTQLAGVTADLESKQAELRRTEDKLAEQQQLLDDRVVSIYRSGGENVYVAALLDAKSISDVLSRLSLLQRIAGHDQEILAQVKQLKATVAEEEATLEQKHAEVAALEQQQAALTKDLQTKADEKKVALTSLQSAKQEKQQIVDAADKNQAVWNKQENQLLAESSSISRELGAASSGSGTVSGRLYRPVPGAITSPFGMRMHPIFHVMKMHTGVDMHASMGEPIHAADAGTVISAGWRGGYGQCTIIDHGNGLSTLYAHQSQISVSVGQKVSRGQVIGAVGSTGYSTGPHLHFEVRVNGSPVNPAPYL